MEGLAERNKRERKKGKWGWQHARWGESCLPTDEGALRPAGTDALGKGGCERVWTGKLPIPPAWGWVAA